MIKINQEAVAQKQKEQRITEIGQRLAEIDQCSVRPLRAKAAGVDTEEDRAKLVAIEAEAETLRAERAGIA